MELTPEQVRLTLYATRDLVTRRTLGGQPIPKGMHTLLKQLIASAHGSGFSTPERELVTLELVNSAGAAEILNCSTRWVRTISNKLGGRNVNGRWIFRRQTVIEYAQERQTR
ncbi:hypothetical protein C0J29_00095 [Mycobacterium paragordonae]|uniref:DNA-binding protein n=1 Tax=Mycobacterium paragordonae TaxID=1389713 RepID=A0ABQ1CDC3_9MYCO|nr:helix-turn-helix domain-containing protein [Mycobacterium paragordonae]AYE93451.1 hypothetical protein C0J29_00095 [Mycobacterium paragordonae]GFG82307.1 hypothetical protein MPRG_55830 [Mycobacterium paragordonae]